MCGKDGLLRAETRGTARMRAIGVVLVAFVPFAAYYVRRYPDWSWMYLVDSGSIPAALTYGMLGVYMLFTWAGFELGAVLVTRVQPLVALLHAVSDGVVIVVISLWGWHRLLHAGTYAEYHGDGAPLIVHTPLFWVILAMGAVFLPALGLMLRRTKPATAGPA